MDYLAHHGTKGMKWGVRRYQNKDGTLTPAGRSRYSSPSAQEKRMAAEDHWVMTSEKAYAKGKKYILDEIRYFDDLEKHDKELAKKHRDIVQKCKTLDELDSYMLVVGDHVCDVMYNYLDNIAFNLSNDELKHHGIKGMKWGVWNEETRNRYHSHVAPSGVIKKGTTLSRVSTKSKNRVYKHDPLSGDIKYVSSNEVDHKLWASYFANRGETDLAGVLYQTKSDMKVASATKVGEVYVNKVLKSNNKKLSETAIKEAEYFWNSTNKSAIGAKENESFNDFLNNKNVDDISKNSARQVISSMALQNYDTKYVSGKALVSELSNLNYGAVQDALGWNVSYDPLIVFNPKKNLEVLYDQRTGYKKQ